MKKSFIHPLCFLTPLLLLPLGSVAANPQQVAGSPVSTGSVPGAERPLGIAYSPNGKWCATANDGNGMDGTVSIFNVNATTGALSLIPGSPQTNLGFQSPAALAYSPSSNYLAISDFDTTKFFIYSINPDGSLGSQTDSYSFTGSFGASQRGTAFARQGDGTVILAFQDSTNTATALFNESTGKLGTVYLVPGEVVSLSFSGNGNYLVRDTATGFIIYSVSGATGKLTQAATQNIADFGGGNVTYSPDGKYVAVNWQDQSFNSFISLYAVSYQGASVATTLVNTLARTEPARMSFSPNSQYVIATVTSADHAYIYELVSTDSGVQLQTFNPDSVIIGNAPSGIAFSSLLPNGVTYFSTPSITANNVTTYAFKVAQPMGTLASAIRNKYLFGR